MFKWIPIVLSCVYDDVAIIVYLSTKDFILKHLRVGEVDIYPSTAYYSTGFLLGSILWNILSRRVSVKRILFLSQIMMLFFTILSLFQSNLIQFFMIRFMQGLWGSGAFIAINILVKHNFNQDNFNKFLSLNTTFVYISEGMIPLLSSFMSNEYSFYMSIGLFVIILIASICTRFLNFKDVNNKETLSEAWVNTFKNYKRLIISKLAFMILLVGFAEGTTDLIFNLFNKVMQNAGMEQMTQLKNISISSLSIASALSTLIIPYFSRDILTKVTVQEKFDWRHVTIGDKRIVYGSVLVMTGIFCLYLLNPYSNNYLLCMLYLISLVVIISVIHYIAIKIMHSVYYSSGCIASISLLSETIISGFLNVVSVFLIGIQNNKYIFAYFILCVLVIFMLAKSFYTQVKIDIKT